MTPTPFVRAAVALIACLAGVSASAQAVYRCGPEGRVYSQFPCAQGRIIDVRDERDEQQRHEGRAVTDAQRALADALEGDRLARESHVAPAAAASLGPRRDRAEPAARPASKAKSTKKKKGRPADPPDADFTAVAPARRKS
jgi:hypothetical protein